MPDIKFVFMGDTEDIAGGGRRTDWMRQREESFRLPNVLRLPKVAQDEVNRLYWPSAVNWIPYDVDHPFNVASCPTKIMDGLASGRPLISSRVPECLLYPNWLPTFDGPREAQALIRKFLAMVSDGTWQPRAEMQLKFVRRQLWSERASTLAGWIEELSCPRLDRKNSDFQDAGGRLCPAIVKDCS
jgi:glycosyltransferase involved in cell wall biosynthesis